MGFLNSVSGVCDQYCEFYSCTKHNGDKIPCRFENVRWQEKEFSCGAGKTVLKCHDFDLRLPISEDNLYVVQYRHPFYSIESWYRMETSKGKDMGDWESFLDSKLVFWKSFIEKWVLNTSGMKNVMRVPYAELANPEFIERICRFMNLPEFDVSRLGADYFRSKREIPHDDGLLMKREVDIREHLIGAGISPEFSNKE